jgi:hypothetical protein
MCHLEFKKKIKHLKEKQGVDFSKKVNVILRQTEQHLLRKQKNFFFFFKQFFLLLFVM